MVPRIAVAPNRRPADYLDSVRRAGGAPVLLDPNVDRGSDVVRAVDGILLTGGGDVSPHLYGELPDPTFKAAEPHRDALELELAVRAIELDVPVLAICRGLQVINVALGGTLVQDIPSMVPRAINHSLTHPMDVIAHDIHIAPATRLAELVRPGGGQRLMHPVNSRHHQSVKRLADSLIVSATAPDGVIEALERPASAFCVCVQWHPENFWRTGEFDSLFAALIQAASAAPQRGK
jgi:putative glutamine amidotransferase